MGITADLGQDVIDAVNASGVDVLDVAEWCFAHDSNTIGGLCPCCAPDATVDEYVAEAQAHHEALREG